MPLKDVCSPNNSGAKPKPTPLPHPENRGVKHTAPYGPPATGDRRNDQDQPPIGPFTVFVHARAAMVAVAPAELPETCSIRSRVAA
jgi:hypothetical protein